MSEAPKLLIGGENGEQVFMDASMGNRHGMIAGATGTGKTVTLQILSEAYSRIGVPVFMADVKGDLSGLAKPGKPHKKIDERIERIGIDDYTARPYPTVFWDLFGQQGHSVKTTISEIGPLLLSSLLELNDTQTGIMYSAFKIADDNGMLLLDLKDLRALLAWMTENRKELTGEYGNITSMSVGAIQRKLLVLEEQGADIFFGEPALDIRDLMSVDFSGNGVISVLDVTELISNSPRLYATFLLWLLSEFFEQLPEVGDADRPKFVMFFDEAHLLFKRAPKALLDKIEQVVRLIRSKGVGVYFISQSPLDVPESVLGQLGLRIQHALRAFTPKDKKVVDTVAKNFRENPEINTREAITQLGIGEALVSTLDRKGSPTPVQRVLIRPPESQIGPIEEEVRAERITRSPMRNKYEESVDRESAYEILKKRAAEQEKIDEEARIAAEKQQEKEAQEKMKAKKSGRRRQSAGEAMLKSAARAIGSQIGRRIIRGVLGSIFGGRS